MSKRLTQRNEKGEAYVQLYSDPDRVTDVIIERSKKEKEVIERLANYEDLENQGMLIKLPCRPYELVWVADEHSVREAKFTSNAAIVKTMEDGAGIGRTAEEAEANFKGAAVLRWPHQKERE